MTAEIISLANTVASITRRADLWDLMLDYFNREGFDMVSYHFHDEHQEFGDEPLVAADGFPEEWVCKYIEKSLFFVDPIIDNSSKADGPFLWSKIGELMSLTPEQKAYIKERNQYIGCDGLAIFVYGPRGQDAYLGLGFAPWRTGATPDEIFRYQCAAQVAHLKYCEITALRRAALQPLSAREREVLLWIARGKSNSDIAGILSLSRHTVDTLTRRLFAKLDVADRTTAAVKAVGSGLVQYSTLGVA